MRILITGSAGFIGFHLAKALADDGYQVFGVDNLNDYYSVSLKKARLRASGFDTDAYPAESILISTQYPQYRFQLLDLADRDHCHAFFSQHQFDVICHLAAQAGVRYSIDHPMAYIDANLNGFSHVLEAARQQKIKHFVYASSSSVYGLNQQHPYQTQHSAVHPVSLYAATKRSNELMAHAYSHLYQLPTTGLRFFTVYGPWGRPDMAPMLFMDAILLKQPIKVFNHGAMFRDFTFIDTVVEGCMRVIRTPPSPDVSWQAGCPQPNVSSAPFVIYNIGGENTIRLTDFIRTMEQVCGNKAHQIMMDVPAGDVLHTEADMQDYNQVFGELPKTSLIDGLNALKTWYVQYRAHDHDVTKQRVE
ncbi:MAG: NAD-dependent epimerase [Legionellales bacterium]|nr:NAD-dependent epimerase [Legionellales bacterium]